jgi:hypothetical protein
MVTMYCFLSHAAGETPARSPVKKVPRNHPPKIRAWQWRDAGKQTRCPSVHVVGKLGSCGSSATGDRLKPTECVLRC